MNKFKIIIISLSLAIGIFLIGIFILQVFSSQSCWHKSIEDQDNKYYKLFDSSEINNLKKVYSFGNKGTEDYTFIYLYKNQYRFIIFEHKSFNLLDPHQIQYFTSHFAKNKSTINPSSGAQFGWGPNLTYQSVPCIEFDNKLSVYFDLGSKINLFDSTNYRCFIGSFNDLWVKNGKGINQIFLGFDSTMDVPSYLFFYRANNSFYIIIVNSISNEYDLNMCNKILNLK